MKKIYLFLVLTSFALLMGMGISYAAPKYNSYHVCHSDPQSSYYKEADYINPWGQQVVAFKKHNKPYYERMATGCVTFSKSPNNYHWKNVKKTYVHYIPPQGYNFNTYSGYW